MRAVRNVLKAALVLASVQVSTARANIFGGPEVEQGFAGYCVYAPTMWGGLTGHRKAYDEVLVGPTGYGFSLWHYECAAIPVTKVTQTEEFEVVTKDQLTMTFRVHMLMSVKQDEKSIREIFEQYGGVAYYAQAIKEPFRTMVRTAVEGFTSDELYKARDASGAVIEKMARVYFEGKPFELDSISVGNIEYPNVITDAIALRAKTAIDLDRTQQEKQISTAQAEKEVESAKGRANAAREEAAGQADAMAKLRANLTPEMIEYIKAQALLEAAKSPAAKSIYFMGAGGNNAPALVKSVDEPGAEVKQP